MRMMDTIGSMFTALEREPMLSEADLKYVALTRSEFTTLSQSPKGARERMVFMAERFGVSKGQLDHARGQALEMALTCAKCGVAGACERYRVGQKTGFTPSECPNATRFSELSV